MLHPGDETEIEVTLSIRQEFGDIVHETVVLTEPPQAEELVLRTMAKAYPSIRIDEATPGYGSSHLSSDEPRRVEFCVFAHGSSTESPVDLDGVVLRSTIRVYWAGAKVESPSDDDLRIQSRRFIAVLDPVGKPGRRRTEILLQRGEQTCYSHVVNWEVVSLMKVSPSMIVIKPGQLEYRALITSRDAMLFRITHVECSVPGIRGRAENTDAALAQTVLIQHDAISRSESGRMVVRVFTDHPTQGNVDVPFVVID